MDITGTSNGETLFGTESADTINAQGGDDYVNGQGGNDTIDGGAGSDIAAFSIPAEWAGTLRVLAGSGAQAGLYVVQRVDGATAEDLFLISPTAPGAATVQGINGAAYLGTDTVANVEQLHFVFSDPVFDQSRFVGFNLVPVQYGAGLTGSVLGETINAADYTGLDWIGAGGGDDTIFGSARSEYLLGQAGNDTIVGGGGQDQAQFILAADMTGTLSAVRNGDGSFSVLRSEGLTVEHLFLVTFDGDEISVQGLNSAAGLGTDTLTDVDQLFFGADGPYDQDRAAFVNFVPVSAEGTLYGSIYDDQLDLSGELSAATVYGFEGSDTITGSSYNDTLEGGLDGDTLHGGLGSDALDGGEGVDTVSYANDGAAVFVNLTLGQGFTNTSFGDTYAGIENVIGSSANDFVIGDSNTNRLDGGAGDDVLLGAFAADELVGGEGVDWGSYEENAGSVFVNLTLGRGYNNNAEGDTLEGIENLIGGLFDDFFVGDDNANRLVGAMGADTLVGAGGADAFVFTYAPGADSEWGSPNVDLILDFTTGADTIELAASAFAGMAPGALSASAFVLGTAAQDADDRIIYDQATGNLFYDADGNGGGAAVHFATLGETTHPAIAASGFVVV